MSEVIGLIAIKGGVGKTSVASSLASDLVKNYNKKVLLIDANYSAPNLGFHMNIIRPEKTIHDVLSGKSRIESAIYSRHGVDVIPGNPNFGLQIEPLKLKDKISRIKQKYDFIVIDSSPSLNEEVLSTMLASDSLFVVSTPDYPTLSCSLRAAHLAKQRGKPISGIIINKIRQPKYELKLEEIENAMEIPVVACIPDDKKQVKALHNRMPLPLFNKRSRFSKEINRLNAALTGNVEPLSLWSSVFYNPRKQHINRQLLKESFYTRRFFSPYEKK